MTTAVSASSARVSRCVVGAGLEEVMRKFNLWKKEGQGFHRSGPSIKLRSLGRYSVRSVVPSSTSTSSRLTSSSTVQVSSTTQAELRLLASGWRFESVHRELGLRRGLTGYS